MRKFTILKVSVSIFSILWIAILVSIFSVVPPGFAQGPIKIGAVVPLADITGDQAAKAMKIAVNEINKAGGLLGRKIELIVVDDEMKPEKGAAAVEKLVTVDKVDFLVGGNVQWCASGRDPDHEKI